MVVARSVSETFPYICKAERDLPPQQQTTFHLRRLPALVAIALDNLYDASSDASRVTLLVGDQKRVTLLAGIAGWQNLNDSSGKPIEFKAKTGEYAECGIRITNPARAELVDMLPKEVAEELAEAIKNGNAITADDAKN